MNKNLYRIVFNQARGMLMVVADIARAGRTASPCAPGLGRTLSRRLGTLTAVNYSLLLALGAIQPVQATIIADNKAPHTQQPTIIRSANGTPQINIQTPSRGGVSRNTYRQFDIDQPGAILNNSHSHTMTQTQLGGWVSGNPWLAQGEATVILNEVNARDPSRLNGYIEVAGKSAQVVIANPAGITCNGCGFINAHRTTLTTGQAQMDNGTLTGFNVERGTVTVEGAGMDSSRQDHTDIIARSAQINAGLWAKDLNVTTGRNHVDAAHQQIDTQRDNPAPRPPFAVDVALLGGMYAGKIRLIGTESGVGVRNAGTLGAQAGTVTVTADGRIENSGKIGANGDIMLASQHSISNRGALFAQGNSDVTSRGTVHNSGSLAARHHVQIHAASLRGEVGSILAAGVQQDGTLGNHGHLTLHTQGQLVAQGKNLAAGDLVVRGQNIDVSSSLTRAQNLTLAAQQGDLNTVGARLNARQHLTARTTTMLNNDGGRLAATTLTISAHDLSSQQGEIIQFGDDDLVLAPPGQLNNREGRIVNNGKNLTLTTKRLDNQNGNVLHAATGTLKIHTDHLQGEHGHLRSNGHLQLTGGDILLDNGVTSAQRITLNANSLSQHKGLLLQRGNEDMTLTTRRHIDNQDGNIATRGHLTLNAERLDNPGGTVTALQHGNLTVHVRDDLNNQHGQLAAGHSLTLDIHAGQLDNRHGRLEAQHALTLGASALSNQHGNITGHDTTLELGTGRLNNEHGSITSRGQLQLNSGALNNDEGLLQAEKALRLDTHGAALSNRNTQDLGGILSQGTLHIHSGALDNQQGLLEGKDDTHLQTAALDNRQGRLISTKQLTIDSRALNNAAGKVQAAGNLVLDTHGHAVDNHNVGDLSSQGTLTLTSGTLDNQTGRIASAADLTLTTERLENQNGKLFSDRALTATTQRLDNQRGQIKSGQHLTLNTQGHQLDNRNDGVMAAGGPLTVTSGDLNNTAGTLVSAKAADLTIQALDNSGGQIVSQQALTLHSDTLHNHHAGWLHSGATLNINSGELSNRNTQHSGGITSQGDMRLDVGTLDNSTGLIITQQDLQLHTAKVENHHGLLESGHAMHWRVQNGDLVNQAGTVRSLGHLQLEGGIINNRQGTLSAISPYRPNSWTTTLLAALSASRP